jgi:hypothetical protein
MKNYLIIVACLLSALVFSSCRNDFEFEKSTGSLRFSQDTVFLDTVFSTIGSSTRTFKVYNDSNDDIVIPTIALAQGDNSNYRLAVDGRPGKTFENIELLAKDSLFVFVETTVDIMNFTNADEFLYEDTILFDTGANEQQVQLVTLIRDAIFLFPERDAQGVEETLLLGTNPDGEEIRISGFVLDPTELTLTNDKPYVIYGYAAIPNNATLTIEAGARLYFHANSGIIASNESSLQVNGLPSTTDAMENEVIFEGDRLEPLYDNVAGQWGTIWLTSGSKNHIFNHATIKNASVGILMDNNNPTSNGATLKIFNSKIINSANVGLLGTTASVEAANSVFNNAGQSAVVGRLGGSYNFNNCTITNYWRGSNRQDPSLLISNTIPNSGLSEPLTQALFTNCIIYGDRNLESILLNDGVSQFNFKFENSLIKFVDRNGDFAAIPAYDFNNSALYSNVIFNIEPEFASPANHDLRIDNNSGANGIASPATRTPLDILGTPRGSAPDAGAYESVDLSGS